MATVTASTAVSSQQPRIPRGAEVIERVQTYAMAATLSDTDVIIFSDLKIPHGALITGISMIGRVEFSGASVAIMEAGIHGGTADLFGSATLTNVFTRQEFTTGAVLPYRVSVSDDATTRYIVPTLRKDGASTSPTVSGTITLAVRYIQDT